MAPPWANDLNHNAPDGDWPSRANGGRGGIRTRDPCYRIRAFQARALGQLCDPSIEWSGLVTRRRRGRDSNPRWLITTLLFESSTLNRSDTSPPQIVPKGDPPCMVSAKGKAAPIGAAFFGTPGRIRTCGLWVRNPTLYPLSYRRIPRVIIPAKTGFPQGNPDADSAFRGGERGIRTLDGSITPIHA
jgi:hypothetical protein